MTDKDKEKVIIDYLLNKYPALNEYKSGDRFNLKKNASRSILSRNMATTS